MIQAERVITRLSKYQTRDGWITGSGHDAAKHCQVPIVYYENKISKIDEKQIVVLATEICESSAKYMSVPSYWIIIRYCQKCQKTKTEIILIVCISLN